MLTQLFQFDIRLEVVVRRPSHNVYDGCDTTCMAVGERWVRQPPYNEGYINIKVSRKRN